MSPREDGDGENGTVLSPEELDIANDENVVSLDDGRYVIAADEEGAERAAEQVELAERRAELADQPAEPDRDTEIDAKAVRRWAERTLTESGSQYGFHISAKAEAGVSHQQLYSDDVGTTFDGLLMWYAQQHDGEMAVEDVLGILLTESNVRVRYARSTLSRFVAARGLDGDDTIADLLETVDDDGFLFPPDQQAAPRSRE